MNGKNEWMQKDGGWERNGIFYPRVAMIKINDDGLDGSAEKYYRDQMVHYAPGCIWSCLFPGVEETYFFVNCKFVETGQEIILPIYTLDFSSEQKEEIIKGHKLSLENFEKIEGTIIGPVFSTGSLKRLEEVISSPPTKGNYGSLVDDLGIHDLQEFIKKNSEWKKRDNGWERGGTLYAQVAKIRHDKLLKAREFRGMFHPNDMVSYSHDLIYKEEVAPGIFMYLASVKKVDEVDDTRMPIPLGMLEFSPGQKQAIKKAKQFPNAAFEKLPSGIQDDVLDEPLLIDLDDDGYYGDDDRGF